MSTRIEFHILQSFAPANLNRDDTGSPKDALFGGARRGRISSQALKRAARIHMKDGGLIPPNAESHRTKRVTQLLAGSLVRLGVESALADAVSAIAIESIGSQKKMKLKDGKTEYLMFLGSAEIEQIAEVLADFSMTVNDPKKAKLDPEVSRKITLILSEKAKGAIDVALFGRMLANLPEANTDASCQVAHAISTHRVDRDFDYYTAVDDLKPDDNAGADMIGTIEFNSSCYYRYSVLDVDQLNDNLGDMALTRSAVRGYTMAATEAIPTGKQNSFAAHNPPSTVLVTVRRKQAPRNLANAFETPVAANGRGYVESSVGRLADYWAKVDAAYGAADKAWVLDLSGSFPNDGNATAVKSLTELTDAVLAAIE